MLAPFPAFEIQFSSLWDGALLRNIEMKLQCGTRRESDFMSLPGQAVLQPLRIKALLYSQHFELYYYPEMQLRDYTIALHRRKKSGKYLKCSVKGGREVVLIKRLLHM